MGNSSSLYVIIPIIVFLKILIWVAICYRRSERYRAARVNRRFIVAEPTTIIHRTVQHGPPDNGISGIENPGYMQQPPPYATVIAPNSQQPTAPPSYDQVIKSSYYPETTNPQYSSS